MTKKSIPVWVKHYQCECEMVKGPFGPHGGKLICKTHNGAFVKWMENSYFRDHIWDGTTMRCAIERYQLSAKRWIMQNGNLFDKIKLSGENLFPEQDPVIKEFIKRVKEQSKQLKKQLKENHGV